MADVTLVEQSASKQSDQLTLANGTTLEWPETKTADYHRDSSQVGAGCYLTHLSLLSFAEKGESDWLYSIITQAKAQLRFQLSRFKLNGQVRSLFGSSTGRSRRQCWRPTMPSRGRRCGCWPCSSRTHRGGPAALRNGRVVGRAFLQPSARRARRALLSWPDGLPISDFDDLDTTIGSAGQAYVMRQFFRMAMRTLDKSFEF